MTTLIARFFLILFAACLSLPAQAQQEVSQTDSQALQAIVQSIIDTQTAHAESRGAHLHFDGEIVIEETKGYYAVTLPHASAVLPNGHVLDLGMVAINASRAQDSPDLWTMTIALPASMTAKDAAGATAFTLSIGQQKASGLWHEKAGFFPTFNAAYKNIAVRSAADTPTATIGEFTVNLDLKQDKDSATWSGPVAAAMHKITILLPEARQKISLDRAQAGFELKGYSPAAASGAAQAATPLSFLGSLMQAGESVNMNYEIEKLDYVLPQEGYNSLTHYAIGKADLSLEAGGFAGGQADLRLRLGLEDVIYDPLKQETANIVPKATNLDIRLQKFPLAQISKLLDNASAGAAAQPALAQFSTMSILFKLPALLSQAGTTLEIKNSYLRNPIYDVDLYGKATADITALNNVTADITALIYDYDHLVQALQKAAGQQHGTHNKFVQNIAAFLIFAKNYAVREKAPSGRDLHRFNFVMNPQGQTLLNGKPASLMPPQEEKK